MLVAAVSVCAALVLLSTYDNAMSAEVLLTVVAPEGLAGGDTEVVSADALVAVVGLDLRDLLVSNLLWLLDLDVPVPIVILDLGLPVIIDVIPVNSLDHLVPFPFPVILNLLHVLVIVG